MPDFAFLRLLPIVILTLFITTGSVAAQTATQSTTDVEDTSDSNAVAPDLAQATIVARVGATVITLGEVIAFRQTLPDQFQQLPDEVLLESILTQMIDQTLLEQAANEQGLDGKAAFRLALRNQRRAVMADAFMSQTVLSQVNDETLEALYQEQFAGAPAVPEVRSSHILVETEATADKIKALLDEGTDFAALAAKYSTDPTAQRGGDRGWLSYQRMVPDYAEAVRNMVEGELGGPVQTPFGWHLIRVDGKRDRPVPPRAQVEGHLIGQLSKQIEEETLQRLRGTSAIERMATELPADAIRADALLND